MRCNIALVAASTLFPMVYAVRSPLATEGMVAFRNHQILCSHFVFTLIEQLVAVFTGEMLGYAINILEKCHNCCSPHHHRFRRRQLPTRLRW